MKVYITKFWQTEGIHVVEVPDEFAPRIRSVTGEVVPDGSIYPTLTSKLHGHRFTPNVGKRHWHLSMEDAVAAIEEDRARRIGSLRKQIAKLEAMEFKA